MVKILDRYVFSESLKFLILSVVTFLTLFGIVDFVSHLEIAMKLGVKEEIDFVLGRFPLYTVRILPIAMLIASMITLSRFSSTNELTVAKALGVSVYRFSIPVFVLSVLTVIFSLIVQESLIPLGLKKTNQIVQKVEGKKEKSLKGIWVKTKNGNFAYFWKLNARNLKGERVSLIKVKNFRPVERIDAKYAKYVNNGTWEFREAWTRNLTRLESKKFPEINVNLGFRIKDLNVTEKPVQVKSLSELYLTVKRFRDMGYSARNVELELYSRLALAFYPVVVVLIGIPFGVHNPRNKKSYTAVLAAAVIVLMWVTTSFFLSLGKSSVLPPLYASFAPLMFFTAVGLFLMGRVET
jgi:lipopolysaccharide export system permease protein